MANTFILPTDVVRDAALVLYDNLMVGNLVNRSIEERFARKVGDSVTVKVPPNLGTADVLAAGGSTSATDVVESSVDVTLEKHFYKRVDLTSDEMTLEVDDFNVQVVIPAINALIRGVENYFIQKIVGGFARYTSGTAGTEPSTHAHILAARKMIKENRGNISNLIALVSPTSEASFATLDIFTNRDFGEDRPMGLREASLGRVSGMDFFAPVDCGDLDIGDTAGTVLVDGGGTLGDTTLHVDGFTAATGYVEEGARFTVAGTATVYTVTARTAIANNEATLPIYPALTANEDDDDAVTFQTAITEDVVYNPSSVAGALIPGAVMGPNQAAAFVKGLGVRITSHVDVDTLAGAWVFDLYAGARVIKHEFGAIMQG